MARQSCRHWERRGAFRAVRRYPIVDGNRDLRRYRNRGHHAGGLALHQQVRITKREAGQNFLGYWNAIDKTCGL